MERRLPKKFALVTVMLVMLLAGWLYWPTIRLPLIYDTLLHIRIAGGLTLGSVWLPTEAFGFYRPMTFFPMLLIQQLFGGYPSWLLHGNNILQHAVNAGLLAWLSWRLWSDWRRVFAAGTIFAVFPFSYQAVTVYGHNVHLAMTGLVLLGLHGYITAVSSQYPRKWWTITGGLFLLMLLTHETVVLFGGLAALVHLNLHPKAAKQWLTLLRQKAWQSLLRLPWLWFLLAGLAYLIIYQFLPISREIPVAEAENGLWLNGLYLLQSAVFPLAWLAHLLPNMSGVVATLLSGSLVGATSVWLAWQRPSWRAPLLLAWGWWAAASTLIGVTLPAGYILRGPRLLYLGGVGVALLWAQLLAGIWSGREQTGSRLRTVTGTAVLLFILITSGQFVQTKLDENKQLTQPVSVMQQSLVKGPDPANAEILLVNLPQWLDVPPNTYPIGVEFVTMLGDYLFVGELTSANLPGEHEVWAVSLPELQSNQGYTYGIQAQDDWPAHVGNRPRHFFITNYLPEGPQTRHTGYWLPGSTLPIAPPNPIAQFAYYKLVEATAETCDNKVNVSLRWLTGGDTIPDTTSIFVQVLAEDGRLLAQVDGPPLGVRPGLLATTPDDLLQDFREVTLPEGETAVPTTILIGVYDFASGARSPATDAVGQPLPDNAWRVPITTCSQTE